MQLEKVIYIGKLIWRKFQVLNLMIGFVFFLLIWVLNHQWLELTISIDFNLPFSKSVIPYPSLFFTGWELMGYFGWLPFGLIPFVVIDQLKKTAWVVASTMMLSSILYVLSVFQLKGLISDDSSDFLVLHSIIFLPFYMYFCLSALLIFFTYLVSKRP